MANIIICDIDGTISKVDDRLKYLQSPNKDWDAFYAHCHEDKPIMTVLDLLCDLQQIGYRIIFCTGRRESCRQMTEVWLAQHTDGRIVNPQILMRKDGDKRHDTLVKPELLVEALSEDELKQIAFILEDRDSMVAKWRELGYRCFQVADGKF